MKTLKTGLATRERPYIVCALAFVLCFKAVAGTDNMSAKIADVDKIQSELQKAGLAHVIVEIALPDQVMDAQKTTDDIERHKASIASMQEKVINRYFPDVKQAFKAGGIDRGLKTFTFSPMFSITIDSDELNKMAVDPDIKRIFIDELESMHLQNSVPLIGMTGPKGGYVYGATGKGQVVAVIDSGVQSNHPFLAGKIINQACFSNAYSDGVSLCANGQKNQVGPGAAEATVPACSYGSENLCDHGTHVSGIAVGANPNPGIPYYGVAKDAELIMVQVFTRFNDAASCGGYQYVPCFSSYRSDTLAALEWIYDYKSKLGGSRNLASVNMSFGSGRYNTYCESDPRATILNLLRASGVAPVASSGNEYYSDAVVAPACVNSVVAVGATEMDDTLALFSNESRLLVDLMAPGRNILSSVPTNSYDQISGTSMASPHVAGAFAAIRSRVPTATVKQIEDAFKTTGVPILSYSKAYTKPRIMVPAALEALGIRLKQSLKVSKTGSGRVFSSPPGIECGQACSHDFDIGTAVMLTATPEYEYRFDKWNDACVGSTSTCNITMDAEKNVIASFLELPKSNLAINKSAFGTITSEPLGINCGANNTACRALFPQTRDVVLKVNPSYGYEVKSWIGCAASSVGTCKVTMGQSGNTVKVTYKKLPKYSIRLAKSKYGEITSTPGGLKCLAKMKTCSAKFYSGTVVTLAPVPVPGKAFQGWSGDCSGAGSCILTMNGSKKASAVFQ